MSDIQSALIINKLTDMDEADSTKIAPAKSINTISNVGATKAGDMNRYLYPTLIVLPLIVAIILILVTAMKFSLKIILVLLLLFVFIVYFLQLKSFNVIAWFAEQRNKKKTTPDTITTNTTPTVIPMDVEPVPSTSGTSQKTSTSKA